VVVWVTRFFPDKQYNYIKRRLQLMKRDTDFNSQPPEYVKEWYKEFIFGYLEPDGIFMLRLLSSNTSDFVCTEVNLFSCFFFSEKIKNSNFFFRLSINYGKHIIPKILNN
jgi:hypothetical protein